MRNTNTRKSFTLLTSAVLILTVSLTFSLTSRDSATAQTATTAGGIVLPNANIFGLNNDNTIFLMKPGATNFARLARVSGVDGNLIGIDFRPADGSLYVLTDTGKVYTVSLTGTATLVSTASPRFAGGAQSLMDFNPVVNALRLIGTNDQNFALVNNAGGNLNVTAVQTAITYDPNDVNKGVDPNLTGGSYTNNFAGAANTLFYGIDFDLDTFVTISSKSATGSSNTGGGQLQTIGNVVDGNGRQINFSPTTDLDIYTDANGGNTVIGMSARTMFVIDLSQIDPNLPLGTLQKVTAQTVTMFEPGGGYIDIAVAPLAAAPTPTPTPTPTPAPAPTTLQAENALLGGGNKVATVHAGFTGTGFVDYADNVAGGFTEFSLGQTGNRTLIFRYANGSTVNRTCSVTVNGVAVGTLSFSPTGAWTTWSTCSIPVNLGTAAGNKAVRVTSTTTAGGPNLDKLDVQ